MNVFQRKDLISILKKIDSSLNGKEKNVEVVVIGMSSIILGYADEYSTKDLDIYTENSVTELFQNNIDVLDDTFIHFSPDYKQRLKPLEGFINMKVFTADPHDIFLLKMVANREKDKQRLSSFVDTNLVNKEQLRKIFIVWVRHNYPNATEIIKLFVDRIGFPEITNRFRYHINEILSTWTGNNLTIDLIESNLSKYDEILNPYIKNDIRFEYLLTLLPVTSEKITLHLQTLNNEKLIKMYSIFYKMLNGTFISDYLEMKVSMTQFMESCNLTDEVLQTYVVEDFDEYASLIKTFLVELSDIFS